jgi:DNA polymerase III subunit delta'
MALMDLDEKYRNLPSKLLASLEAYPGQSYIFHGDTIEEVKAFADEWVQACACLARTDRGGCGSCRHCQLIISGNYPELNVVEPSSKSRIIPVDSIREFQARFYLKAAAGVTKIGLVVEADRMPVQAQNAFLKTLEEPPPNTLLILLTTRADALLNTIKSRCRVVSLAANNIHYEPSIMADVVSALGPLKGKDGAALAQEVLESFRVLFAGLKKKSQNEIEAGLTISDQENEDASLRKKFKEKVLVMTEGRYRFYREQIVSLIEVWVAQNFMRSHGVEESQLAYPQLIAPDWTYDSLDGEKSVGLIEALKSDLDGNVNEDLALENFFLQICQK